MESNNQINSNQDVIKNRKHSTFNTESDPILLLHLLRSNLKWFFVIISFCLLSSYLYLRYTIPVYQSNLIFQVGSLNTANQVLNVDNFHENKSIDKDIEILRSKLLFRRAISRLPLAISFYKKGTLLEHELYKSAPIDVEFNIKDSSIINHTFNVVINDINQFELRDGEEILGFFKSGELIVIDKIDFKIKILKEKVNDFIGAVIYFKLNDNPSLANNYISKLSVFPINSSAKTINISFKDYNATKARDMVTAIAEEYIDFDIEERSKSSKKILEFVDNQLDKYYNKLKLSENKIQKFQKDNNFKGADATQKYFDRSTKLEDQLIDIELQKNVLVEISSSIESELKNVDVYKLLSILAGTDYSSGITSLVTELKRLLLLKENMLYEVTDNSGAINSMNYKIDVQKKLLTESINTLIKKLTNQRIDLIRKIDEIESHYTNIPANELEYARLQRVLSIDEKFFSLLMDKRTEYSISEAGFVSQHTILDEAGIPKNPISPNKILIISFGFIGGIFLSIILLLVKYIIKNTISSLDDIVRQSHSSFGILGVVPKYKYDIPVSQLVVNKNPKSIIAESFRVLRSNLQFISEGDTNKTIAITSTISGEGKTFCAINLAGIIAYSGKKVVIIDLDMRKPKIHVGFAVENNIGMSTILINKTTIEECIHQSELENLHFITSGPIPPNPSELIISGKLEEVVNELKQTYDYVIIDNPPIGLVSDAMEMLKKADYPIYVFKSEYSKKYFVNNVDKLVLDNNINKLSIILNSIETGTNAYGGKYGYGSAYGYGYGYGHGYAYGYGAGSGYYAEEVAEAKKHKWSNKLFKSKKK
jgi:tyrosine-protein kinase Etk/Wzc